MEIIEKMRNIQRFEAEQQKVGILNCFSFPSHTEMLEVMFTYTPNFPKP